MSDSQENTQSKYETSGVSSRGAEDALSGLLKHVLPTRKFSKRFPLAVDIGYFANVINIGGGQGIAFGTDGVGTKTIIAELMDRYDTIGIDCVAMNVNDLICVGARPVSMVDYIGCSFIDARIFSEIGKGLAEGARQGEISISGGEISQIKEIINGVDLIGACIGHVSIDKVNTGKDIQPGDMIVGLASSGGNWFYECTLYRASLVTLLTLLVCLLLLRFAERPSIGLLIGSALSLSFLTQARTNLILFVPFALVYLWKKVFSRRDMGRKWLAGYLVIFFLASLPLLVWVKQIHGNWGPYDQTGGENFYLANSPDYSVRSVVHDKKYRNLLGSERLGTRPALQLILKDIAERPLDVTKVYLKKVYYYFNDYEVPTTHNYYLSSELSSVLKWGSIPFGVIATLGISGFFWSWKYWKRLTLLHAFFLGNLLAYLPFFMFSRYRLSMVPFLCIFSAFTLQMIYQRFKENDLRALSSVIISVFALGWFVKTAPLPEGKIRILDYINLSSAYLNNNKSDDDDRAYNYLERSWELSRSLPADLRNTKMIRRALSHFYFREADFSLNKGDAVREAFALRRAIAFNFPSSPLHARYSSNLIKKGEPKKALLETLIALTITPNSFDLNLLAGKIYTNKLSHPLWGLYHFLLAKKFADQPVPSSLEKSIQNLQGILNLNSLPFDLQKLTLKVRDRLAKEALSLKSFPMNPTLPVEASKWESEKLYNYRLGLHRYLLIERGVNPAFIYHQLGMLEWNFFKNDNSAFYYLEKAWDYGLRNQQLASLLNDLSEKLATRNIS